MLNPIAIALEELNVGAETSFERLSVIPLTMTNPKLPMDYITLDEALARGDFEVTEISEGGRGARAAGGEHAARRRCCSRGEELVGAKQNRIVNLTILVPAKATVVIPVSCVEAGRWHRQSRRFAASRNAQYSRARAHKVAQVTESLASIGSARSDQQWIWSDIAQKSARMSAASDTSAMSRMFETHQRSIDAFVSAFPRMAGQCGAVFLIDRVPIGLECFESEAVFGALFPKLVRSYALDAIDTQNTGVPNRICVDDAKAVGQNFIRSVATAAETKGMPFPTVGLGQTVRVAGDRLAAAALVADERVVHLAAFELGV